MSFLNRLTIESNTWTKESHGLFDYDLKDVLQVKFETRESVHILRNDLEVLFDQTSKENLIAKIARSGNRHWWIYHQYCFSGADHASKVPKDTKTI